MAIGLCWGLQMGHSVPGTTSVTSHLNLLLVRPQEFISYFQKHDEVLTELEKATQCSKKLEAVYKEFELQKVCYLPLNAFLLKPSQRLVHLRLLLSRLCEHYPPGHHDYADCHGEYNMDLLP